MTKYRYLLKNILILSISNLGTKVLSFVLIPLYTNCLTTAEYGTYDLYSSLITLLTPILTLNIIEAVMRFCLEQTPDRSEIFSIGLRIILGSSAAFLFLEFLNLRLHIFPVFNQYAFYLAALFILSVAYSLLGQFARGLEQVADIAAAGVLSSLTLFLFSIALLLFLDCGLSGYFLAHCLAYLIPAVFLAFRIRIWKHVRFRSLSPTLRREMLRYSTPMILNNTSWWVTNLSDRYIVTWLCGLSANGVYSVAYKLPSILNIFQSIFGQAWTLSAVKERNNVAFYSTVYQVYNSGMSIVCSALIFSDRLLARILLAQDFYIAWKYAPFLMLSSMFGALSGVLGGILIADKQSTPIAKSAFVGAFVNAALNIALIYATDSPLGAAIATFVSYVLVWLIRIQYALRFEKLRISLKRDLTSYAILLLQTSACIGIADSRNYYGTEALCMMTLLFLYRKDLRQTLRSFTSNAK